MSKGGGQEPAISTDINVMDKVEQWQEGWIGYKDKIYEYNEYHDLPDMGIDKRTGWKPWRTGGRKDRQMPFFLLL